MTETIKITGPRYALDPVAFAKALILAPLIVAAFGFWVFLIPVFAVVFGGPLYLIVGTPVLMIYLHYAQGDPRGTSILAFATVVVGAGLLVLADQVLDLLRHPDGLVFWIGFALVFAPLWGLTFGKLYNRWRSDLSRRPLPPLP